MLSGEGNAGGERWKKKPIVKISKKALLHVQHTFFVHFFAFVSHDYNVKLPDRSKLFSYTFCGGNVARFLVHLFFTTTHFHLALVAASISYFATAATKFSGCSSNEKKCLLCFLSLALHLCRPFSRWASLACCLISLFLGLSLTLYSKFVDMRINLSLIL